jgi:phosphatidylinositol-3-phosphatase
VLRFLVRRCLPIVIAVIASTILMGPGSQGLIHVEAGAPDAFVRTGTVPAFDHIFVILEENHSYSQVIGASSAPYINSLANQYSLATNYSSISHPSLPNYLALTGGSTFGLTQDCKPSKCPINARNLTDNIEAAGKTWKAYIESMPGACSAQGATNYSQVHNPFLYYKDIATNAARCTNHVVPYTALAKDLAGTTPNFVWITPNLCDDMNDCPVGTADNWLKKNLAVIFNSAVWKTQNSLVLLIWDEGSANHVPMIAIGPSVKPGYKSAIAYSHYSVLRTIEAAWGLPALTTNDSKAVVISDFWH